MLFCRDHEAHSCQKATACGCQAQACSTWLKTLCMFQSLACFSCLPMIAKSLMFCGSVTCPKLLL